MYVIKQEIIQMQISLPANMERYIQTKIDSGMYHTPSEVVGHALKAMQTTETQHAKKVRALVEFVQVGIDAADRGEFSDKSMLDIINQNILEIESTNGA